MGYFYEGFVGGGAGGRMGKRVIFVWDMKIIKGLLFFGYHHLILTEISQDIFV